MMLKETFYDRRGAKNVVITEAEGLGDVVAHVLHTGVIGRVVKAVTGLDRPCGGCRKRQDILNKLVPFKRGAT
jgi:hypothetical protein